MALAWQGSTLPDQSLRFGPLALIAPLLPPPGRPALPGRPPAPCPQPPFSPGPVPTLPLAGRLCQPPALAHRPAWGQQTGADLLRDIPAQSLNRGRLGRALGAFFTQR